MGASDNQHDQSKMDLTDRQLEVLALIDERLSIKEMADRLGVTDSAINQRIRALKIKLQVDSHKDLAIAYREIISNSDGKPPYSETACSSAQLANPSKSIDPDRKDELASEASFADSFAFPGRASISDPREPRVVPEVLNGLYAVRARWTAIITVTVLFFAAVVLSLAAGAALTNAIRATFSSASPSEQTDRGARPASKGQ